jgi:hypothetical protein
MTQGESRKYGYVSPYLQTPPRSLAEAQRDRQANESPAKTESVSDRQSPANEPGKR